MSSILKRKILKANNARKFSKKASTPLKSDDSPESADQPTRQTRSRRNEDFVFTALDNSAPNSLCTKNIVKNYARAICNFVASDLATTYIEDLIKRNKELISA